MTFSFGLLVLPLIALSQGSGQGRFAATFTDGGSVSWDEFYLELARRHRGKQFGKQALEHLIEKRIVEIEAKSRSVVIPKAQIDAYIDQLRRQLKAQKLSLEKHLEDRAMGKGEFRNYVQLSLIYDHLARADLGLSADAAVTPDKRKLWLSERKRLHEVTSDLAALPAGVVAIVAGKQVPLYDLGRAMARNLRDEERNAILRQMVAYRLLLREAAARKITVTDADHEAALARKRENFAEDPNYKRLGVTLEKMLGAQGRSLDDLRKGEVFRAEVLVGILGHQRHPTASLRKDFANDSRTWLGRVGGSRETMRILIGGAPRRTDDKARSLCTQLKQRVRDAKHFKEVARRVSEDTASKARGGNLGYLHRNEEGVAEEVLAAAFLLEKGEVSEPIRTKEGWNLLLVNRVLPPPRGKQLWVAMRRYHMGKWLRSLVANAALKLFAVPK